MGFDRVYTVWDYYDGICSGIAEYSGKPHYYHREWNKDENEYPDTFTLTPIDDETLSLALEQRAIWLEWELKFHQGQVLESTHPGLPGQNQKYAELEIILDRRIPESSADDIRAHTTFRPLPNQPPKPVGVLREFEVEWEIL
jgi:hypothetical protein